MLSHKYLQQKQQQKQKLTIWQSTIHTHLLRNKMCSSNVLKVDLFPIAVPPPEKEGIQR